MRTLSNNSWLTMGLLILAVGATSACSKKSSGSSPNVRAPTDTNPPLDTDELTRRCRIPVRFTNATKHEAALEAMVQARVNTQERVTTMCVAADSSPLKNFNASFRVEYEDNYGLRWVTFRKRDLIYSDQRNGRFRLLYLDMYGYVELKAVENSAGKLAGSIRLAGVKEEDSYLQDIEDFLDNIKKVCNESPVKCMNPVFYQSPTSGQPPTEAQILKEADDALAGKNGVEAHTLGTVTFDLDDIEGTLF